MDGPKRLAIWLTHPHVACFNFEPRHAERLARALGGADMHVCAGEAEFLSALPGADAALVWGFRQEWFARSSELRWVVTPAAGRDYFNVVPPAGVQVRYGRFHGRLMAETVVGMMLAACRGILASTGLCGPELARRAGLARTVRTLRGAHIVILGFGHIGRWIGRRAKPFGVRITGIERTPGGLPDYFEAGDRIVPAAELETVLPAADHLVACLPGDSGTDRILNAHRLSLLPRHAWLYNVGRGNAVDEVELGLALCGGRIAGACLDVVQNEPLPADSPLRALPRLLLMPHASAFGPDYMDCFLDELIAEWRP